MFFPPIFTSFHPSLSCGFLSFILCRWHSTNSVFSPVWNPGGSMNLCMSGWHLSVDICTPPETQAWQDQSALLSNEGISHPWSLHYHWELCGVPDSDRREPGCDSGWPAVLRCQHHCDNLLLQINSPHQEDISIPHPGGGAGSGPGSCYLPPWLLQLPPGWCACMCHLTTAAHLECSSPSGFQPTQVLPCHTTPLQNTGYW